MIYVKIHKGTEEVVAICDENLIGKKFSEGKLYLDVKESFYKGEFLDESELKKTLTAATNLNVVGEESIKFLLKEKVINENSIIRIEGVPHAQIYSI